jgi:hypothetical protein
VPDDVSFRVPGLQPRTTYWFRVRAFRNVGATTVFSGYSNTHQETTR